MSLRLFGIRGDQAELHYDNLVECLHPEDRPKFSHALEQCLSGTGNLDIEYRVAWADGSFRWLRTKGDALLDLDGDPIKVLWVTEDVSQRKDMDARVRFLAHHDLLSSLVVYSVGAYLKASITDRLLEILVPFPLPLTEPPRICNCSSRKIVTERKQPLDVPPCGGFDWRRAVFSRPRCHLSTINLHVLQRRRHEK